MSQRLFIFLQSCVKTTTYLHQLKEVSTLREEVADAAVSQEKKISPESEELLIAAIQELKASR